MQYRLPLQPGEWIDRDRSIEFRFEGHSYRGYAGDVVSTALWANGVRMQGRSFKYHRPRGIYSLAGHDANVILEDAERTNLRGDCEPLEPGMDLRAVNTFGGLAGDRLRIVQWFSRLMPVGFYYKAFHTPRWLFPFHERQIRKIAGLGTIKRGASAAASPKDYAFCELLVVGAGPAGLASALAAADAGVQVLLVDENPRPGGSLTWQWAGDDHATRQLDELVGRVSRHPHITIRTGTQVAGCYADRWCALVDDTRLTKLRAQAMVVATGCLEQPAIFGNNDLPGVMLASAAQRLIHHYAVKPCDRCVVLASNADGYRAALDLVRAGVDVAAVVDQRPASAGNDLADRLRDAQVIVHQRSAIYEALPGRGQQSICGAVVCPVGDDGNLEMARQQTIACDAVVMSVGWMPAAAALYQAGGRFRYCEQSGQLVPQQLPDKLFAAGRIRGIYDLSDQLADGHFAGLAAARQLGKWAGELPDRPAPAGPAASHAYPIHAHAGHKNFVDLDEDLHLDDLINAHQEGYDNIELLKRYTTIGMGPSQGKLANMNGVRVLTRLNGASIDETGTTTSRPFYQPVSFGKLAGRRFHPVRRTPMHAWHTQAGAEFVHGGAWLRPEFYRDGKRARGACILQEAQNVRTGVGLIDVSTLGKLELRGPDVAEFLERVYTGRFRKQHVGRVRYGIACDDSGVMIEDGVIVRLADDHFYVTCTTSGAAAFYREWQRLALMWQLDVTLNNATSQLAAMNLAGPLSRDVLASWTDLDLSPTAFPYLGARRGHVAGVPATLLRVGFVGELGYEIHLPAGFALHVWDTLLGSPDGHVRPFGVEAQRLLRLEKGHLIVAQDTDALTNPFEANLDWAVKLDKPYFEGQRSLRILRTRPRGRHLVGFRMATGFAGPFPEECHLVIAGNEIAGRVTSIASTSTVGYPVGLAMVSPQLATPGQRLQIRVAGGQLVAAEVVTTPFYDPEDLRQT